jgi:peptidoglycan hydrolase CwlO-like protein
MLTKQSEISETEAQIASLKVEIKVLEERISKRNELLKNRARSFQENGSVISYIDVLTGASDFSEFIDRVELVATLMKADRDILREHKADKDQLETSKRDLEKKADSLQVMLKEIETLKQNLNTQKDEKDKLMASLQLEEEELENYKMNLEEEAQLLSSQESAIQKAIELEKKNQAAKQAQNSVSSDTSASAPAASAPPVSNGYFTRPTSGVLTSGFGSRWGANHFGVDIAQKGTVPVVSAADGVVMNSYYSSSYGNVVFISHSIEGQIYTTVYAHMSSRSVSAGQTVSKGQQIGYQGNTGQSYG